MAFVRCPCGFRLCRLAQHGISWGAGWRNREVFGLGILLVILLVRHVHAQFDCTGFAQNGGPVFWVQHCQEILVTCFQWGFCVTLYRSWWEAPEDVLLQSSISLLRDLVFVLVRRSWGDPALSNLKGQIECQKICQNKCQIECEKIFQIVSQLECQIDCQSVCQIECQNACQIEWQIDCQNVRIYVK